MGLGVLAREKIVGLQVIDQRTKRHFLVQAIERTKEFYRCVANMTQRVEDGQPSNGNLYSSEGRCLAIREEVRVALGNIQRIVGRGAKPKLNSQEWKLQAKLKYLDTCLLPPLLQQIRDRQDGDIARPKRIVYSFLRAEIRLELAASRRQVVTIESIHGGTIRLDGSDD